MLTKMDLLLKVIKYLAHCNILQVIKLVTLKYYIWKVLETFFLWQIADHI